MSSPSGTVVKKPISIKRVILRLLLYFVVLDVCVITLYPYFAMLCTALKNRVEIFSGSTILPVTALWSNFIDIWSRAPMARYLLNSILIAGGSTVIAMLCGIPAAYALARMKFKGQTAFLGFVIVSQMFAPVRYPQYRVEVDAALCKRAGVSPSDILDALSGYVGGVYTSNINRSTPRPPPRPRPDNRKSRRRADPPPWKCGRNQNVRRPAAPGRR